MTAVFITDWSDFEQVFPLALEYQVGIEILEFVDPDTIENGQELADRMRNQTGKLKAISFHGPYSDLVPASRDPLIRQATLNRFQAAGRLADMVGSQHLVLHSGFIPKTYPKDQWIQNASTFWINYLKAKPFSGKVHVENVYEDDYTTLKELVDTVNEAFSAELLTICLDIGHVNANSSRSIDEWISELGKRIGHVHLQNNSGLADDHSRLDKGTLDVAHVLNLLSTCCPASSWTIETTTEDIEPSLIWMGDQGYPLSSSIR